MIAHGNRIKIFTGRSNVPFAESVCTELGIELGKCKVDSFADGEANILIEDSVRGSDVYIIQSTCNRVNDNLMELLVMIDACRRSSAGRINAVIPYFGYARQDRTAKGREPISAKLVANLITVAGADRVLTLDLHSGQLQGFFDIPVDHLVGSPIFAKYYLSKFDEKTYDHDDFCVVSPDIGSVARSRAFATKVHMPLAIVDKRRQRANMSEVKNVIGDVRGKTCILFDDIVDTGGSLCHAAEALIEVGGATKVYACASHGVLSNNACDLIENSCIEELMLLNTIPLPSLYTGRKIRQLDAAPMFAKAITRIFNEQPLSDLL
ncbi:MAG: ribose-phosphate pyrophosphokinase [Oscillospiraceae bacterium]|nr:ribose-phosphate pyrophosphokinase [Oscillospiraceae bacterium]